MPKTTQKKIAKRGRKANKRQKLSFLCSLDRANEEGLYFPKRRIRVGYPSKIKILKRIETQNFKNATQQRLLLLYSPKQEMTDCWEEMARQIKTFKRKFRKVEMLLPKEEVKEVEEQPISFYETTNEFIQKSCESSNPPDHKDLLKNLLLVIAKDRLAPISSEFGKICSLVRECMPMRTVKEMFAQNNSGMLYFQFQIKDIN